MLVDEVMGDSWFIASSHRSWGRELGYRVLRYSVAGFATTQRLQKSP